MRSLRNKEPSVLIVVLDYNGGKLLEECISSIERNTNYQNFEILVVDNGDDNADEYIGQHNVDIRNNGKNLGFSIGNNIGIYENPGYDYYLLLNNDTEVKENWLRSLVDTAELNDNVGLVGPKLLYENGNIQSAGHRMPDKENIRKGINSREFCKVEKVDAIHGASLLIKKELIDSIGYLNEIFSLFNEEEWDYCARTRNAGFNVYVDGCSEVIHKEDMTKKEITSDLVYLTTTKNKIKFKLMNQDKSKIIKEIANLALEPFKSILNKKYNRLEVLTDIYIETLQDIPYLLKMRYKEDIYVPSYYCESIRDFSKRYEEYNS